MSFITDTTKTLNESKTIQRLALLFVPITLNYIIADYIRGALGRAIATLSSLSENKVTVSRRIEWSIRHLDINKWFERYDRWDSARSERTHKIQSNQRIVPYTALKLFWRRCWSFCVCVNFSDVCVHRDGVFVCLYECVVYSILWTIESWFMNHKLWSSSYSFSSSFYSLFISFSFGSFGFFSALKLNTNDYEILTSTLPSAQHHHHMSMWNGREWECDTENKQHPNWQMCLWDAIHHGMIVVNFDDRKKKCQPNGFLSSGFPIYSNRWKCSAVSEIFG